MKRPMRIGQLLSASAIAVCAMAMQFPSSAMAQQALVIKSLVEKTVAALPPGPLFWRLDNFGTLAQAQAAAGATGLVAETGGKIWLFTLGPANGVSTGGVKVAEIGPLPKVDATQFLLRVNEVTGPPGSVTPVHSHPGSEVLYVLSGETSQQTSNGVTRVAVSHSLTGHGADMAMKVSSSGSTDLLSLALFVVDATKPFSSPAKLQ